MFAIKKLSLFTRQLTTKPILVQPAIQTRFFPTDKQLTQQFFKANPRRISKLEPRADELIAALRQGDYAKCDLLLKQKVDINGHNRGENTPLTDAAQRGDTKGVEYLLKRGANPTASCDCPYHQTALHYAAANGHVETVSVLLKYINNPNILDSRHKTAFDLAQNKKVRQLLEAHACRPGKEIEKDPVLLKRYLPR